MSVPSPPLRQGLAAGALITGIIGGLFGVVLIGIPFALFAVIAGARATLLATRHPRRFGGRRAAIAGMCTGAVGLVLGGGALCELRRQLHVAQVAHDIRGIMQGLHIYANEHGEHYPPTLQALITNVPLSPEHLVDPGSGCDAPACDYYYVAGLTDIDPDDWIVLYSDPSGRGYRGVIVLYVGGARHLSVERFSAELERFKSAYEEVHGQPPTIIPPTAD